MPAQRPRPHDPLKIADPVKAFRLAMRGIKGLPVPKVKPAGSQRWNHMQAQSSTLKSETRPSVEEQIRRVGE